MKNEPNTASYDVVFVGASVLCMIEAVYQSLCGKSVLMIEQQDDIGGAWRPLRLFGLHDVENAIHYFLPDPYAFDFMKDVLDWKIVPSSRKYRVFQLPVLGPCALPYDNLVGRFIGRFQEAAWQGEKRGILSRLFLAIDDVVTGVKQPSYYVGGGAPEMLAKTRALLSESDVDVRLRESIDRIYMDKRNQTVEVSTAAGKVISKAIVFSHGSRISNLTSSEGDFLVVEKVHPRPAVHLLVRNSSPARMIECIFTADPLIKYVHDVTRYAREAAQLTGKRKLFVLALHKNIAESEAIYLAIFEKLKAAGMLGKGAILEEHSWWNALLPPLDDEDLGKLKAEFGPLVEFLRTENFSRGIGYRAANWGTKLRLAGSARNLTVKEREPQESQ